MEFEHKSVLLTEVIEGLNIKSDGVYVDGTLGGAGHSSEILKRLKAGGRLIGVDRDEEAIEAATERLEGALQSMREANRPTFTVVRDNYGNIPKILRDLKVDKVDGILLDLGVSSHQFDTAERGFSYRFDSPLDMRMDRRQELTARDIVNEYSQQDLFRIIRDYGEEQFAQNIAKHIVLERSKRPIETTFELNEIIRNSIPAKKRQNGHPSKKTFQAIRIECNGELEVLKDTLKQLIDCLSPEGRIAVITFHSLEDRIVKNIYKNEENPCTCPPSFPVCVCGNVSKGKVLTRKPIVPTEEELEKNSRSKPSKLRIFVRG